MANYLKKRLKPADQEETTLLGAHVPNSVAAYIALFCEADGCTKSSIIEPLIKKWVKKAKKEFSEDKLIDLTVERAWDGWINRKAKRTIFTVYTQRLGTELRKRLPEPIVEKIIEKLKYVKDKERK